MDCNFEWRTREEKLRVVAYWWKQQEGKCCICQDLMEPYHRNATSGQMRATIEHLIPRRENGPNTVGNVRLAHAVCNHALGAMFEQNRNRESRGLPLISEKEALANARGRVRTKAKPNHLPTFRPDSWYPRDSAYYPLWVKWRAEQRALADSHLRDVIRQDKPMRGTLAHAVMTGEVSADLSYRRAPLDVKFRPT